MTELEKLVWAAAFAAEHHKEYWFRTNSGKAHLDPLGNYGFSCGEIADQAVKKLREALECDDGEYLLPVKEGWKAAIPEEIIVPQELKLSQEAFNKVLDLIKNPPEPTEALKKLMKDE